MAQAYTLPSTWKLPQHIRERAGSGSGKQRLIHEQNQLLMILHEAPAEHDKHRHNVFFWRDEQAKWHASIKGNGLYALGTHIQSYADAEQQLDKRYLKADCAKHYFELLECLLPLQRAARNLAATLQSAREIVGEELVDYRNQAEEVSRNLEILYTECKNGLDYAVAKKSEEQSELQNQALSASHRLNVIMAMFLPITALASVLGVNLTTGFEHSEPWLFFSFIGVSIILGLSMRAWVLK